MSASSFIAFHEIAEEPGSRVFALTFAIALARGPAGVVLVFNRHRRVWELPGGFIDPGESAREAARRELAEEAGCFAETLQWLGVVEVEDGQRRHGAVFGCDVATVPEHVSNTEIDGIAAWSWKTAPRPLSPTDHALLEALSDTLTGTGPPKTG